MTRVKEIIVSLTEWVSEAPERLRQKVNKGIRDAAGLSQDPPPICDDPREAYLPVDGVARLVHGDLSSMMIGGLASLFFEMLHPHSMAGVAQHSRYREDPLGRVLQTANFIGFTTYGPTSRALGAIERVRAIHEGVRGVADDGQPYYANDPRLLLWIHAAGSLMFLRAYQHYGAVRITDAQADQYVREVAQTARDLGVEHPPTTLAELLDVLRNFRPELRLSADGVEAKGFVERGVVQGWHRQLAYRLLVQAAYGILDPWARSMLGVKSRPLFRALVVRPAARSLAFAVRLAVPPTKLVTL